MSRHWGYEDRQTFDGMIVVDRKTLGVIGGDEEGQTDAGMKDTDRVWDGQLDSGAVGTEGEPQGSRFSQVLCSSPQVAGPSHISANGHKGCF